VDILTPKRFWRRVSLPLAVVILGYGGVVAKAFYLQVIRYNELSTLADQRRQRVDVREAKRGDILDVNGNVIATSFLVKTVCADPSLIGTQQMVVARTLAPLLGLSEQELCEKLTPQIRIRENNTIVTNRYVVLKRKVLVETWEQIRVAMSNLNFGVDLQKLSPRERSFYNALRTRAIFTDPIDDQTRFYVTSNLFSHVVGYMALQEKQFRGRPYLANVGAAGIELVFENELAGVPGWYVTETDVRGREIGGSRVQDLQPQDGLNVVLTLDSYVQHLVRTALSEAMARHSPVSASAIVVKPSTGEILAMVCLPDYDPNAPGESPPEARRNRLISDVYEPGSTFKVVVVGAALNEGIVGLDTVLFCENGRFEWAGRTLRDHEPYGDLSVKEIIGKSSNIGAAKIGLMLGPERLYRYVLAFGFGARTGIMLPGEVGGIVHPVSQWSKLSITRIPMGQEIAVTPLQMVMAMCAIANKGVLMQPKLVDRLEDRGGRVVVKYTPQPVRRVISEEAAALLVEALKSVVSKEGTAPRAMLRGYSIAGKTGTAQKVREGVKGYVPGKYFSSFIGFLPAHNPQVCIGVFLDEPRNGYYGGQVAAPVFRQIAEKLVGYLNIPPDVSQEEETSSGFSRNDSPRD